MRRALIVITVLLVLSQQAGLGSDWHPSALAASTRRAAMLARRLARRQARMARHGTGSPRSSVSSSSASRASSAPAAGSAHPSSASSAPSPLDPLGDTLVRSRILVLGQVTPVLGSAKVFIEEEPIVLKTIAVTTTADVSRTIQSLLVYDQDRHFLARAFLDPTDGTNRKYKATLPHGAVTVPKREERSFYARAQLTAKDDGGQSQVTIQVSRFTIEATGYWSSLPYTKYSTDTFLGFQTARSRLTAVKNAGQETGPLVSGSQRVLGSFGFSGVLGDASAHLDVTDLSFSIEQTGGVQVTNVQLLSEGLTAKIDCVVATGTVTCSSIPDLYGALGGGARTMTLYGTVTVPSGLQTASLRLTLNAAGSLSTPGSITWSDGTSSFAWVDLDAPVATGTLWKL